MVSPIRKRNTNNYNRKYLECFYYYCCYKYQYTTYFVIVIILTFICYILYPEQDFIHHHTDNNPIQFVTNSNQKQNLNVRITNNNNNNYNNNNNNNHGVQEYSSQSQQQYEHDNTIDYQSSFQYVNQFSDDSFYRPITFFHIPKTAGTAIEHAAGTSQRSLSWGSCMFNHGRKRTDCIYPPGGEWPDNVGWWHIPSHFFPLARINPYHDTELFGVIRSPYDRMVSEFYYTCTLKVFDWRPDQCNRTRLYDKQYMNEWIAAKIQQQLTSIDRSDGLAYLMDNGHFTPQHEYVFAPYGVRMLDYVLTMDDPIRSLSHQFNQLMNNFQLYDIQLYEKFNAFGAEDRNSNQHLTVHDLSNQTKQLIQSIYTDDFYLGQHY